MFHSRRSGPKPRGSHNGTPTFRRSISKTRFGNYRIVRIVEFSRQGRAKGEYNVFAQKHRTVKPGKNDSSWHEGFPVASVTPVKIARRGKTYTMRTRPKETDRDRVIFQTDHLAGLTLVQCLLHTGTVQRQSKVLLVIEIQAETYEPALPPP